MGYGNNFSIHNSASGNRNLLMVFDLLYGKSVFVVTASAVWLLKNG